MAFTLEVNSDGLQLLKKKISTLAVGMAKSTAIAMTTASKESVAYMNKVTANYVDRPTPYTQNAWGRWPGYVDKARLSLWIGLKVTGASEDHYLRPLIEGGDRPLKRNEKRLGNRYLVPTGLSPLRFNRYGNIPGGQYTQVLSRLKAFNLSGFNANRSASGRSLLKQRDQMYFIQTLKDGRQAIYSRQPGRKVAPVFVFQDQAPNYERRFPAQKLLFDAFNKSFDKAWDERLFNL
jgi:hypothetical protein